MAAAESFRTRRVPARVEYRIGCPSMVTEWGVTTDDSAGVGFARVSGTGWAGG